MKEERKRDGERERSKGWIRKEGGEGIKEERKGKEETLREGRE